MLSCGRLLAVHPGAIVVTVFAGDPPRDAVTTKWDRNSGLGHIAAPVVLRRNEDLRALARLGAEPRWLGFVDCQYGGPAVADVELAAQLARTVEEVGPGTVLMPLGIGHPDHLAVAGALRRLARERRDVDWLAYEDVPYRLIDEQGAGQAIRSLYAERFAVVPAAPPLDPGLKAKRDAIACYRSQVRAFLRARFPILAEPSGEEQYWRLEFLGVAGSRQAPGRRRPTGLPDSPRIP